MGATKRRGDSWRASLHGGHSGQFCCHAEGTLEEILEAAVEQSYQVFGVSEHAPRVDDRFLYPEEKALGFTGADFQARFDKYRKEIERLSRQFGDRLVVLRGFEAEVIPTACYVERMRGYRREHDFDYMIGSVHWVDEIQIDGPEPEFRKAVERCGGLEKLAVAYYRLVSEMIEALQPDVVGHFDLIKLHAGQPLESPAVRAAAVRALETARQHDCILDLNTAGYRKGLGEPYPAPWLVRQADAMGLTFCFGDDSHSPQHVGQGLEQAREYLLANGVKSIQYLTRVDGVIRRQEAAL